MYELMTFDVTESKPKGMGRTQYKYMPRKGDWIEIDIEQIGTVFEVVMVAHSSKGSGSDIYVKYVGETLDAVKSLCGS